MNGINRIDAGISGIIVVGVICPGDAEDGSRGGQRARGTCSGSRLQSEVLNSAATAATLDNPAEVAPVDLQAVFQGTSGSTSTFYTFGRRITLYAASPSAGPQATFDFVVGPPENFGAACRFDISGYYVIPARGTKPPNARGCWH
jgi:hypothetical protein